MQALTLINLCARDYHDVAFERIARDPASSSHTNGANWLDWLNDAQRAVVLVRPDANAVTQSVLLVPGTRQTLPAGALRLLDANCNTNATGSVRGEAVRFAERDVQDIVNRSWHKAQPSLVVRDVFYNDKKDPLVYWVSPPVPVGASVYLEITVAQNPANVDNVNDDISLSPIYATPIRMWMLYCAYSMGAQATTHYQRSIVALNTFFNLLGVKLRNDIALSPNAPDIYARPERAVG